jgi:hypothetical protein
LLIHSWLAAESELLVTCPSHASEVTILCAWECMSAKIRYALKELVEGGLQLMSLGIL